MRGGGWARFHPAHPLGVPFSNQGAAVTDQERLTQIDPALGRGFRPPAALVLLTVVLVVGLIPLAFYGRLVTNEMTEALVASAQEHARALRASHHAAEQRRQRHRAAALVRAAFGAKNAAEALSLAKAWYSSS